MDVSSATPSIKGSRFLTELYEAKNAFEYFEILQKVRVYRYCNVKSVDFIFSVRFLIMTLSNMRNGVYMYSTWA